MWDGSEDGLETATGHVENWIKPVLGDTAVTALTTTQIQRWLEWMASQPPKKKLKSYDPTDPETIRKRRDTGNRICNTLIAILNRAFKMRPEITSDAAWRKIEKFENVAVEKQEFLDADEVQNLLSVCDTDFAHLVFGSIASGMRYTEQTTMRCRAYMKVNGLGVITFIQRKTGKVKHIYLNEAETTFFDSMVEGKKPDDLVFTRFGEQWEKSNQQGRLHWALKRAGIDRHIRWHDLRHSAASLLAAGGASLAYISKFLGHSSQRVTERYTHLVESHIAQTIRSAKPVLTLSPSQGGKDTSKQIS